MNRGLSWARQEVAARHLQAQAVWHDSVASDYNQRIHARVTSVLDRYFRALDRLESAVDRAESVARGTD
jgi:hypothetical protein